MSVAAAASTVAGGVGIGSLMRSEPPRDALAGAQRHQFLGAERITCRDLPRLGNEGDLAAVARQAIEIGTVDGSEGLELLEGADRREHLGIQLDAGVRREDAGAPAGCLLRGPWMRRAVGAQEEARAAARDRSEERHAVALPLED